MSGAKDTTSLPHIHGTLSNFVATAQAVSAEVANFTAQNPSLETRPLVLQRSDSRKTTVQPEQSSSKATEISAQVPKGPYVFVLSARVQGENMVRRHEAEAVYGRFDDALEAAAEPMRTWGYWDATTGKGIWSSTDDWVEDGDGLLLRHTYVVGDYTARPYIRGAEGDSMHVESKKGRMTRGARKRVMTRSARKHVRQEVQECTYTADKCRHIAVDRTCKNILQREHTIAFHILEEHNYHRLLAETSQPTLRKANISTISDTPL